MSVISMASLRAGIFETTHLIERPSQNFVNAIDITIESGQHILRHEGAT
jgi:hypothetical protein